MVDGSEDSVWSDVADGWSAHWGRLAAPVWEALIDAAGVEPGVRVLDVGCGSGEFLGRLRDAGAIAQGADPAAAMVDLARRHAPTVRAEAESLPFPAGSFDVVTAINALQFAEDTTAALREFVRVSGVGARIAVANWAEASRNDIDVIERAVAAAQDDDVPPDGPLRGPGGLERALADARLEPAASGIVDVPWRVSDEDALVAGILLGEDADVQAELRDVVVDAARSFRVVGGGYLLRNSFRWAVARVPDESSNGE